MSTTLDLDHFRDRLLEERKRVQTHSSTCSRTTRACSTTSTKRSRATTILPTTPPRPTTASSTRRLRTTRSGVLDAIDAALKRIDDGTYGTCANCGEPIPAERLEAVPWATSASTASARKNADERAGAADLRRSRRLEHGCADAGLGRGAVAGGARAPVGRPRSGRVRGDRRRPADEADRLDAARFDESLHVVGPVRDPPRPELRASPSGSSRARRPR